MVCQPSPGPPPSSPPPWHGKGAEATHLHLSSLASARGERAWQLGGWLLHGHRHRVHELAGYGSFDEYCERLFGFVPRETRDRLRVARKLERLPALEAALRDGTLVYSVLRELTRVADPWTEEEWRAAALGKTVREVERMVSGRHEGDRPGDPKDPEAELRSLTFRELPPRVLAQVEEARRLVVRSQDGMAASDADVLEALCSALLAGRAGAELAELEPPCPEAIDDGAQAGEAPSNGPASGHTGSEPAYQVALARCPDCLATWRHAQGEAQAVDEVTAAMADCDARHIGHVDEDRAERASTTIPPRVRRMVVARHGATCAVPGCRLRAYQHVHHLDPREEGGTDDPERLLLLCPAHHRATHVGSLLIEGAWSTGFTFRHADGSSYGDARRRAQVRLRLRTAFEALTHGLGFPETQAKGLLDRVRADVAADEQPAQIVERALRCYAASRTDWRTVSLTKTSGDPSATSVPSSGTSSPPATGAVLASEVREAAPRYGWAERASEPRPTWVARRRDAA